MSQKKISSGVVHEVPAIVGNGGTESQCGWCKDRWGLSWQITPRALTDALAAGGGEAKRAFESMMTMKNIDNEQRHIDLSSDRNGKTGC
jgi:predicted 3-demethylubiquinone-9 3-methyltransferase (glyoxalase superfamily)